MKSGDWFQNILKRPIRTSFIRYRAKRKMGVQDVGKSSHSDKRLVMEAVVLFVSIAQEELAPLQKLRYATSTHRTTLSKYLSHKLQTVE